MGDATMIEANQIVEEVQHRGLEVALTAPKVHHFSNGASPGDAWRQGDVYVTLLDAVPAGTVQIKAIKQLAPGNTPGSRHCLDAMLGVRAYRLAAPGPLDGPVLLLTKERTVTHPEHGHVVLPPGVYAVTYQRNLDVLEREQRVLD